MTGSVALSRPCAPVALALPAPDDTSMTESEVESLVLDVVRRHTQNDAVTPDAHFDRDLRLSEPGRQMLWASMAQAFAARGVSLPSQRFYLSDFLTCPTPAAVRDAIREKVFRVTPPKSAEPAAAPPAPAPTPKPAERKAKPTAKKPTVSKKVAPKKVAPKKAAGAAKGRRGRR